MPEEDRGLGQEKANASSQSDQVRLAGAISIS